MNDNLIDPNSDAGCDELLEIAFRVLELSLREDIGTATNLLTATFARSQYPGDAAMRIIFGLAGAAGVLLRDGRDVPSAIGWLEAQGIVDDAFRDVDEGGEGPADTAR